MSFMIPENISIETFRGCNARCIMCPVEQWAPPYGPMKDEVFSCLVRQMSEFKDKLKSVALFGNGEPLLDKKLEKRIVECKQAGIANVGFTSNGSLLTETRAAGIIEALPDWIVISFDSLDKEAYENIRIRLKFEQVLAGINNLIAARNRRKAKTHISLRFIEQEKNKGQFEGYVSFWAPKLDADLDELHYGKEHNWASGPEAFYGNTPCGFVFHKSYVLRDGSVVLCCTDSNAEYNFGNVMETPLLEIMNKPRWQAIRQLHASGKRSSMKLCSACNIPELNNEGVLSMKMTPSGTVFSSDTLTPFDNEQAKSGAKQPFTILHQP